MYKIKAIRGTIFCKVIGFDKSLVAGLAPLLPDYIPVIIKDVNIPPMWPIWQLIPTDNKKEIITFNGEKIDIVNATGSEYDEVQINIFSQRCSEIFAKILELSPTMCKRLAFAPSVIVSNDTKRPDALYDRIFAIREFKNEKPDISNVSQVFGILKNIRGREIRVNHVANFHVESELAIGPQPFERYVCDFDINTRVNPQYIFDAKDMVEFFNLAPTWFKDYYELYI